MHHETFSNKTVTFFVGFTIIHKLKKHYKNIPNK